MNFSNPVIRPPSEARSILLQITHGCSHNRCTFCPAYKQIPFSIRDTESITRELHFIAAHQRENRKLFLCDGDALILPQDRLLDILEKIRSILPDVTRVGTYANAKSIAGKTDPELKELNELGLKIVHMGLESGDDRVLKRVGKWGDCKEIITQGQRVRNAGIKLFVTVLLGLGGKKRSSAHAENTGKALSQISPEYTGALTLIPCEGTFLHDEILAGDFTLPSPGELLAELRLLLCTTHISRGLFYANHASNYLPLRIRLPGDKESALATIDAALKKRITITPEWMRGL
ncbi:MAG: radical SAM protein [Chitinispirillaceae bacterium]